MIKKLFLFLFFYIYLSDINLIGVKVNDLYKNNEIQSIASYCYIQHSISDENYPDRAIRKQPRGHNVCLYDALLMYMRIGKTRYKSHNAVEKEIIELHTMKLIIVEQVVYAVFLRLTIVCLYSIINNNHYHVLQIGDNYIIFHIDR